MQSKSVNRDKQNVNTVIICQHVQAKYEISNAENLCDMSSMQCKEEYTEARV
jgi:hypothetical protein